MSGIVGPALTLAAGLAEDEIDQVLLAPTRYYRGIGPEAPGGSLPGYIFQADVTEREEHRDQLYITEHPIEMGPGISDHAYKRPAEVQMRIGWSNASHNDPYYVQNIYQMLLRLQADRIPFNLYTGKRVYFNMLLAGMVVETDAANEFALRVDVSLRQIFLVQTQQFTISTNPNQLGNPMTALPTQQQGSKVVAPASNLNTQPFTGVQAFNGVVPNQVGQVPIATATPGASYNTPNIEAPNGINATPGPGVPTMIIRP